jgi:hypothetical protein
MILIWKLARIIYLIMFAELFRDDTSIALEVKTVTGCGVVVGVASESWPGIRYLIIFGAF